jgi:leucyl-tRNA synthetase
MNEITKLARDLRKNQTTAEKLIWAELCSKKLGVKFRRQHPLIYNIAGTTYFFICDFACLSKKIIIEIDGSIHKSQEVRDKAREHFIKNMDFTIIRFSNEMIIEQTCEVIKIIQKEINNKQQ